MDIEEEKPKEEVLTEEASQEALANEQLPEEDKTA